MTLHGLSHDYFRHTLKGIQNTLQQYLRNQLCTQMHPTNVGITDVTMGTRLWCMPRRLNPRRYFYSLGFRI